jgi:hypothetical protein
VLGDRDGLTRLDLGKVSAGVMTQLADTDGEHCLKLAQLLSQSVMAAPGPEPAWLTPAAASAKPTTSRTNTDNDPPPF